jgi:ribulose-bisphosphate carboxylase large chain
MSYLRLGETIDPSQFLIVEFYVESEAPLTETAVAIAAESSIGTWTEISTMREEIKSKLGARIFYVNEDENIIKIAYPLELFEIDNLPQMFSDVAGNVFGMKAIKNLRVRDIIFPEEYVKQYDGPEFGIQGIREYMDVGKRPLLGTIIKPKVGLSPKEHAEVAYDAWLGGVDVVKDDENLTDQGFNPFGERLARTMEAKRKVEKKTGEKKMYVPNITASISEMLERAELVKDIGNEVAMIDIITVGWSGVQHVREQNFGLILHGHRAMHAAFTHSDRHGISMLAVAKVARLAGIDQLHTGTVVGKMRGGAEEVVRIDQKMREEWYGLKPTMPIASGGLHPGLLEALFKILGTNVIVNCGGGIHGHPQGTYKGAMAARQAVDAFMEGKTTLEYAKSHKELDEAIKHWGYKELNEEERKKTLTYQFSL